MRRCTFRLFPASNANPGPERIAIIKVQISGSPGIFHSVASMVDFHLASNRYGKTLSLLNYLPHFVRQIFQ